MKDRYTKAVLTIIAISLIVLTVHHVMPTATAIGASGCGTRSNPCYVVLNQAILYKPLSVQGGHGRLETAWEE